MKYICIIAIIVATMPAIANADCDPMPAAQHVEIMQQQLEDGFDNLTRVLQVLNEGAQVANDTSSPKLASVIYNMRRSIIKTILPMYYTAYDLAANEQTSETKEKQISALVDKINAIEAKDAELLLMAVRQTPNLDQLASGNLAVAYNYLTIRPTAIKYCYQATANEKRSLGR